MEAVKLFDAKSRKAAIPQVQSGDTVKVHQTIREGSKSRVQVFEGVVIRARRLGQISANITVRRVASGVGVEKTFLLHSPNVTKVDVVRRTQVRRQFLSYLRDRQGKSARLKEKEFDRLLANVAEPEPEVETAAEAQTDAEVTELNAEDAGQVHEDTAPLEAETKPEAKAAAADDADKDPDAADDEAAAPAEEVQEKLDKADDQDTSAQQ